MLPNDVSATDSQNCLKLKLIELAKIDNQISYKLFLKMFFYKNNAKSCSFSNFGINAYSMFYS